MKKFLLKSGLALCVLMAMASCGSGGSKLSQKVDLNILSNKEEVQKIYDEIVKHLGKEASRVDEIRISVSNPAEKMIKKSGDVVELDIWLEVGHPSNSKQLEQRIYFTNPGGWQPPKPMDVSLGARASAEERENFRLEDYLWSFTDNVSFEVFNKVLETSFAKKNDPDKYTYCYINSFDISSEGYQVRIHAKLKSNDQTMNESFDYDFNGNPI